MPEDRTGDSPDLPQLEHRYAAHILAAVVGYSLRVTLKDGLQAHAPGRRAGETRRHSDRSSFLCPDSGSLPQHDALHRARGRCRHVAASRKLTLGNQPPPRFGALSHEPYPPLQMQCRRLEHTQQFIESRLFGTHSHSDYATVPDSNSLPATCTQDAPAPRPLADSRSRTPARSSRAPPFHGSHF